MKQWKTGRANDFFIPTSPTRDVLLQAQSEQHKKLEYGAPVSINEQHAYSRKLRISFKGWWGMAPAIPWNCWNHTRLRPRRSLFLKTKISPLNETLGWTLYENSKSWVSVNLCRGVSRLLRARRQRHKKRGRQLPHLLLNWCTTTKKRGGKCLLCLNASYAPAMASKACSDILTK